MPRLTWPWEKVPGNLKMLDLGGIIVPGYFCDGRVQRYHRENTTRKPVFGLVSTQCCYWIFPNLRDSFVYTPAL